MLMGISKVKTVRKESKHVDFKEKFDVNSQQDWCEVIKDIVAMANTGGGYILIGVNDDGTPSHFNVAGILSLDQAKIIDKIAKYTGEQFSDIDISEIERDGAKIAVLRITGTNIPMVFVQPGTYDVGDGKQKIAFGRGTIYFRHGAKSEPANNKDIKYSVEREVERTKKSWLGNIRQVMQAPAGYRVNILPPEVIEISQPSTAQVYESSDASAVPIRITDDPTVPAYLRLDTNKTHPHRMVEVVKALNDKLFGKEVLTSHDIQCVRKTCKIDGKSEFIYKPLFSSPQYSDKFIDWLITEYNKDNALFISARNQVKEEQMAKLTAINKLN